MASVFRFKAKPYGLGRMVPLIWTLFSTATEARLKRNGIAMQTIVDGLLSVFVVKSRAHFGSLLKRLSVGGVGPRLGFHPR